MADIVINLIIMITKIVIVFGVVMLGVAYLTLAERKFAGYIQDRLGPNRAGPRGLFQPFADFLKMLFKEDFIPDSAEKFLFFVAPGMIAIPSLTVIAIIPFGDSLNIFGIEIPLRIADVNIGILYLFAVASLSVYGLVLGGWSANNKYSLLGGLRSAAQMISYELVLGLSVIGVLMITGSLRFTEIVQFQTAYFWGFIPKWNIFLQPVAFIIFITAAFAETNRLPFDLVEAEQELVGGYHTEYNSIKWMLYFLSEYANVITASAIITTLFFGGWHLPWFENIPMPEILLELLQIGSFIIKTAFFAVFFIWVRWTFPRFKYNQLMNLSWKALLPIAILNILITSLVYLII
ncbi:NADH-quinone oxidoreductase subunit NuoH [candidate division KSB1 bacterium]